MSRWANLHRLFDKMRIFVHAIDVLLQKQRKQKGRNPSEETDLKFVMG